MGVRPADCRSSASTASQAHVRGDACPQHRAQCRAAVGRRRDPSSSSAVRRATIARRAQVRLHASTLSRDEHFTGGLPASPTDLRRHAQQDYMRPGLHGPPSRRGGASCQPRSAARTVHIHLCSHEAIQVLGVFWIWLNTPRQSSQRPRRVRIALRRLKGARETAAGSSRAHRQCRILLQCERSSPW